MEENFLSTQVNLVSFNFTSAFYSVKQYIKLYFTPTQHNFVSFFYKKSRFLEYKKKQQQQEETEFFFCCAIQNSEHKSKKRKDKDKHRTRG